GCCERRIRDKPAHERGGSRLRSAQSGRDKVRAQSRGGYRDVPAPARHSVARRADVVLPSLLIKQRLLRGSPSKELRITVLGFTVELANEIGARPPEVDEVGLPARPDNSLLKHGHGELRFTQLHPTDRLTRPVCSTIGETYNRA